MAEENQRGPLRSAIRAGDHGLVKRLLDAGEDPNKEFLDGFACPVPAWMEIFNEESVFDERTLEALIHAGADMHWVGAGGVTVAIAAVCVNKGGLCRLIEAKAPLESQDADGATALMKACIVGNAQNVRDLVKAGASLETKDRQGRSAIVWAANWGRKGALLALIEAGAELDAFGQGVGRLAKRARACAKEMVHLNFADRAREAAECAQILDALHQREQLRNQTRPAPRSPAARM